MDRSVNRRAVVRLPREQRVRDILQAAREVFCERGYADAAVAEIAARAAVVEGTIYKYFESKHDLLLKVLEQWYEELLNEYAADLQGIRGLRERLRYLVWRHLRTIRDDPLLARLMFLEVRTHADYPRSRLFAMNRRYTALLTAVLDDGVAAGELRAGIAVRAVRDMVYGGMEHVSWRYMSGQGSLDIDREADDLLAILWDGIAARNAPADAESTAAALHRQLARLERVADRLEIVKGGKRA